MQFNPTCEFSHRRARSTAIPCVVVAGLFACGSEPSIEELSTETENLAGSDPLCGDYLTADATVFGPDGGKLMSPATYGQIGSNLCAKAYRVNIINYWGAKWNGGTVVGWGGTMPT